MAAFVEPLLVENLDAELEKTYRVLDALIMKGNLIASYRKTELQHLDSMLKSLKKRFLDIPTQSISVEKDLTTDADSNHAPKPRPTNDAVSQPADNINGSVGHHFDEWTWEDALNSTQLMSVADLLDGDEFGSFSASFNI